MLECVDLKTARDKIGNTHILAISKLCLRLFGREAITRWMNVDLTAWSLDRPRVKIGNKAICSDRREEGRNQFKLAPIVDAKAPDFDSKRLELNSKRSAARGEVDRARQKVKPRTPTCSSRSCRSSPGLPLAAWIAWRKSKAPANQSRPRSCAFVSDGNANLNPYLGTWRCSLSFSRR